MGVNHGQWKASISWVKKLGHVVRVGVLRLYSVKNFGWSQFLLVVPIPNSSFVWILILSDFSPVSQQCHRLNNRKTLDKRNKCFEYICKLFSGLTPKKSKQECSMFLISGNLLRIVKSMNTSELRASTSFIDVVNNFLGNR